MAIYLFISQLVHLILIKTGNSFCPIKVARKDSSRTILLIIQGLKLIWRFCLILRNFYSNNNIESITFDFDRNLIRRLEVGRRWIRLCDGDRSDSRRNDESPCEIVLVASVIWRFSINSNSSFFECIQIIDIISPTIIVDGYQGSNEHSTTRQKCHFDHQWPIQWCLYFSWFFK